MTLYQLQELIEKQIEQGYGKSEVYVSNSECHYFAIHDIKQDISSVNGVDMVDILIV